MPGGDRPSAAEPAQGAQPDHVRASTDPVEDAEFNPFEHERPDLLPSWDRGARSSDVHLTRDQAERVIQRALQLQQAEQIGPRGGMSLADIQDVAAQVGVEPDLVRRALKDVRLASAAEYEPSHTERLLGPSHVAGAVMIDSDPETARMATASWMTHDEGMKRTGSRDNVDRWVKDKRLLVEIRRGLQATRGNGALRDLKAVSVDVRPEEDGSIVYVDADTTKIQHAAGWIAASWAVAGLAMGAASAGFHSDAAAISSDVVQFVIPFVGSAVAGVGTAVVVARTWITKVKEGVDQALDGITMTTTHPELPPPPPTATGWRRTALRWLGGDR